MEKLKDKNENLIREGDVVNVPEPNGTDIHNNEFQGTVIGFRNGNVLVEDQEENVFEIEPERLERPVVYNVFFYNKNDELIDETQIDEKSEDVAWDLFKEFGHKKKKGDYCEFEETIED